MYRISDIVFTAASATVTECTRFVNIDSLAIVHVDGFCLVNVKSRNVTKVVVNAMHW